MEPMVGVEPTTYGLRNRCSATELHWRPSTRWYVIPPPGARVKPAFWRHKGVLANQSMKRAERIPALGYRSSVAAARADRTLRDGTYPAMKAR